MAAEHYLVNFDPVALAVGPLSIHWYGIAYALAFLSFWLVQKALISSRPWYQWKDQDLSDLLFYGMLGVIVGGRVGYVLFYSFGTFLENPLYLFKLWDGGMSFHGGLLGVIVAMGWFGRKTGRTFWQVADFVAPVVPLGLALGRLGNFIGGELWGRASDVSWAMIFPASLPLGVTRGLGLEEAWQAGMLDSFARHPSQLYQAGLEGLGLFLLLVWYSAKPRATGSVSGLFLAGYGVFRMIAEFFREPDEHLGYLLGEWLTMGMLLSLPMVLLGIIFMVMAAKRAAVSQEMEKT